MNNISSLFQCIFFGDMGLLTMTPRYLFLVLFPIMILLGILGQLLPYFPFLKKSGPLTGQLFYGVIGLGCTTAALAALDPLQDKTARSRMAWILVLLVPCSAKMTIIAAFAAMVTFRVFLVFLLFFFAFSALLYFAIGRLYPLTAEMALPAEASAAFHPLTIFKDAFQSVKAAALPFCAGSILISAASHAGLWDRLSALCAPFLKDFLGLPEEASGLLFLSILKRDFGAAALLSVDASGAFDAMQLITVVLMMIFSMPCFNSAVLLVKQQRLPGALILWLGSLFVCLFIGKVAGTVLSVCLF